MKISIIGSGQIGGTLARRFTALGHQTKMFLRQGICDPLYRWFVGVLS